MNFKLHIRHILLSLLVLTLLAACSSGPTASATLPEAVLETTAPAETVENTATPTASPAPVLSIPAELVLWAPASVDPSLTQNLAQQLGAYATANALRVEQREQLTTQELGEEVRVVVALTSAPEINALAAAVPTVQFLAVGVPDATVGGNVHALLASAANVEDRAFLAGYLLALVTPDYRVGVLSQAGSDDGTRTMNSFVVGARFYCGLCNSRFGPVLYYPKTAQITDPGNPADWKASADVLLADSVTSIFIQPEVSSAELVSYLETAGVKLVGIPGQAGLGSGGAWLAVMGSDLGSEVVNVVARLMAGEAAGSVSTGFGLSQVNQEIITEGRLALFESTARDLQDGLIRTSPVQ
ncbi:MAG: hypothetical protein WA110_08815 [Anaerolineaceae bacterium]